MLIRGLRSKECLSAVCLALIVSFVPAEADSTATYTYDSAGQITTAVYDNGLCIAYAYDANGNRTSQTNTAAGGSGSLTWGSGVWGCQLWTSP